MPGADWDRVRQALALRAGSRCEATGVPNQLGTVWEVHHRRAKGRGGSSVPWIHDLGNLVLLPRAVHAAVHSYVDQARAAGFIIGYEVEDPWNHPITLWSGRRVLLARSDPFYLVGLDPPYGAPFATGRLTVA